MDSLVEPLKPIFIILVVLAVAGLVFLALRLDKTTEPSNQKGQSFNWKRIE